MKTALTFLADHWLAFAFIGTGLVALLVALLLRRRLGRGFVPAALAGAGVVLAGVGGASLPGLQAQYPVYLSWGFWLFAVTAVVLFGMVLLLVLTGVWSKWAVLAVAAVGLLGFGGWALDATGATLSDWFWTLTTVEFLHPWWLLLLLLVPVSVAIAWRALWRFESV